VKVVVEEEEEVSEGEEAEEEAEAVEAEVATLIALKFQENSPKPLYMLPTCHFLLKTAPLLTFLKI